MRPIRRTWEEKGECLCLSSTVWSEGHTTRCERTAPLVVFNTPFPIKRCNPANYVRGYSISW